MCCSGCRESAGSVHGASEAAATPDPVAQLLFPQALLGAATAAAATAVAATQLLVSVARTGASVDSADGAATAMQSRPAQPRQAFAATLQQHIDAVFKPLQAPQPLSSNKRKCTEANDRGLAAAFCTDSGCRRTSRSACPQPGSDDAYCAGDVEAMSEAEQLELAIQMSMHSNSGAACGAAAVLGCRDAAGGATMDAGTICEDNCSSESAPQACGGLKGGSRFYAAPAAVSCRSKRKASASVAASDDPTSAAASAGLDSLDLSGGGNAALMLLGAGRPDADALDADGGLQDMDVAQDDEGGGGEDNWGSACSSSGSEESARVGAGAAGITLAAGNVAALGWQADDAHHGGDAMDDAEAAAAPWNGALGSARPRVGDGDDAAVLVVEEDDAEFQQQLAAALQRSLVEQGPPVGHYQQVEDGGPMGAGTASAAMDSGVRADADEDSDDCASGDSSSSGGGRVAKRRRRGHACTSPAGMQQPVDVGWQQWRAEFSDSDGVCGAATTTEPGAAGPHGNSLQRLAAGRAGVPGCTTSHGVRDGSLAQQRRLAAAKSATGRQAKAGHDTAVPPPGHSPVSQSFGPSACKAKATFGCDQASRPQGIGFITTPLGRTVTSPEADGSKDADGGPGGRQLGPLQRKSALHMRSSGGGGESPFVEPRPLLPRAPLGGVPNNPFARTRRRYRSSDGCSDPELASRPLDEHGPQLLLNLSGGHDRDTPLDLTGGAARCPLWRFSDPAC